MLSLTHFCVIANFRPFETGFDQVFNVHSEWTIAEVIEGLNPPEWFLLTGAVQIRNGAGLSWDIPRKNWSRTKPKPGTLLLITCIPLGGAAGGGGASAGRKDILMTVASLALIAASIAVPTFGVGFLGAAFKAGAWGARLLGAGLGLIGSMALKSIAPPPIAPNQQSAEAAELPSIAGVTNNAVQRGSQSPCVMGVMVASPPQAARPYTSFADGNTYAHAIVHLWGRHSVSEIKINNIDVNLIPDIELELREGIAGDAPITVAPLTVFETGNVGVLSEFKLSRSATTTLKNTGNIGSNLPLWHYVTAESQCEDMVFRLVFPSGISKSGAQAVVPLRIAYRLVGSGPWTNGPEIHLTDPDHTSSEIRQQIRFRFGATPPATTKNFDANAHVYFALGYCGVQSWSFVPDAQFNGGAAQPFANNVNITDDGIDIYCETSPPGVYEFRMMRGLAYPAGGFNAAGYVVAGTADGRLFDVDVGAGVTTVPYAQRDMVSAVVCEVAQAIRADYPIAASGLTLIAVKVRGLQLQSISATFKSWAPIWTGTVWGAEAETNNPAALYRRVLRDYHGVSGKMPDGLIDDENLGDFYDYCALENLTCNMVLEQGSVHEVLQMIAAAGMAIPRQAEKWGVIIERDRTGDTPRQVLTPISTPGLTITRSFDDIPHAITAEFIDANQGYRLRDDVYIYRDGYSPANATDIRNINYKGVTNEAQVLRRARLDMGQMEHRKQTYVMETWIENLISRRGDLVELSADILGTRFGYSKVIEVSRGAGVITAIKLEDEIDIVNGPGDLFSLGNLFLAGDLFADNAASAVSIRLDNGTATTANIAEGVGVWSSLTFQPAIVDSARIAPGCVVAIGQRGLTTRKCIIFEIRRKADERAQVTLIDLAPQLHMGA